MKWFKFYGQDWMTDMKIINMGLEDRLCYITLLSLASNADDNGRIRNCSEEAIIKMSHLPDNPYNDDNPYNRAKGCLERYAALRCVTLGDNGDVTVLNFSRRQDANLDGAERQKKYRERLKTRMNRHNNSDVTLRNDSDARLDKKRIEENRDRETKENHGELGKVRLTSEEYAKFLDRFGESITNQMIFELDTYIGSKGDKYRSHYATLLSWAKRKHDEAGKRSISKGRGIAE